MSGLILVKRLGWLNVTQRRDYFMRVLMYRCIYGNYLKDLLIQVYNNVFHELLYKESFLYNGPHLRNTLPDSLKVLAELRSFKYRFKTFLKTE